MMKESLESSSGGTCDVVRLELNGVQSVEHRSERARTGPRCCLIRRYLVLMFLLANMGDRIVYVMLCVKLI